MTRSATAGLPDLKSYMNLYKPLQQKRIFVLYKELLTYDLYLRENVKENVRILQEIIHYKRTSFVISTKRFY